MKIVMEYPPGFVGGAIPDNTNGWIEATAAELTSRKFSGLSVRRLVFHDFSIDKILGRVTYNKSHPGRFR